LLEIVGDGCVGRILHFHNKSGRFSFFFRCKILVGPVHEGLGDENGIQPVGESYNVAFILFHTSVAPHHDIHLYQIHQTFGEFRQTPALCKAKVIEVQIIARNDDGNYPGIFIKMPFVQTDIHIFVGYRLEKHLCRQADTGFLHTESGRDFEQGRSERAYPFGERLGFQVFYLIFGEGIAFPGKAAQSTDFLGSNDIILLHETVPFRKNGKDITIELYAQQYNHHAEEIGEEKACQLSDTDVLAEKFPNKSVHISHIYN